MFTAGKWPCIILLYIYGTVATSLVTQSVPVIGDIARYFGLSHVMSGWVISIPSLITALGALFGGWLIDRIGDRRVIFAGSLCAALGNLGVFFAQSLPMLFSSRLLEGVGYLSLTVGAVTLLMRTTSGSRRNFALGLWTSHTAVGIGLTLSLVAPLAGHDERWRWAFGGHALLMLILAALAPMLPARDSGLANRRLSDILTVLRSIMPYRVALASAASAFVQTGIMAALTLYVTKTFAVGVPVAAGIGTLAEVFVVVGCLGVGYLKGRCDSRLLALVGGITLLTGGLCFYMPAVALISAVTAICAFSLGIGVVNGLIWTFVPGAAPSVATLGATSGLVAQATYLGVLLGPPTVFATLLTEGGYSTLMCIIIIATVVQLAPLPIWTRRRPTCEPLGTLNPREHHGTP